jgi:hypothetical protein
MQFPGAKCRRVLLVRTFRHGLPAQLLICGGVSRGVDHMRASGVQVYNAEIAKIGQWTFQLHSNYAFIGRKEPDFPGGLVPNHALQGTGEWAYGITDWWEMGFYTPYAVDQNLTPYSNAVKIRELFVIPNAAEREFFYGVNFEFSYAMPQFSETRWNMEIRPIVGWRKGDYEFIVNPIVDLGFGQNGGAEFVPAARFARNLVENLAVGVEYYTDLGPLQSWLPLQRAATQHLCGSRFQDRALRRKCWRGIRSDTRLRSSDVQDDHRHGFERRCVG